MTFSIVSVFLRTRWWWWWWRTRTRSTQHI